MSTIISESILTSHILKRHLCFGSLFCLEQPPLGKPKANGPIPCKQINRMVVHC